MSATTRQTDERIEARLAARKGAEMILELAAGHCADVMRAHPDMTEVDFWEIVRGEALKRAPLRTPPTRKVEPMNDYAAEAFERQVVPYGKHKGQRVGETPLAWLDWLVGSTDDFKRQVARYLANERVAMRLEVELDAKERRGR